MTTVKMDMARSALVAAETAVGLRARAVSVPGARAAGAPAGSAAGSAPAQQPVAGTDRSASAEEQRVLPVPAALSPLFPAGGIRRGTALQVRRSTSVLLSLAQHASGQQAWCALVGMPQVGLAAAAGAQLCLDRVVVVPDPGPDPAAVLGALVDGFDVLVVGPCPTLRERDRRSLSSRLRHRGAVLLTPALWPGADLVLEVDRSSWAGVGTGHGVLESRQMEVSARGHGTPPRQVQVHLGAQGVLPVPPAQPRAGRADLQLTPPPAADLPQVVASESQRAQLWAEAG